MRLPLPLLPALTRAHNTSVGTHRALIKQLLTLAGALLTHFTNYLTAARNLAPAGRNFPSSSVNYFVIKSKSTILLGMHGKFLIFNSEFAPSTIISLTGFFSLRQSPSLRDETSSCMVTRDPMKISPVQMNPRIHRHAFRVNRFRVNRLLVPAPVLVPAPMHVPAPTHNSADSARRRARIPRVRNPADSARRRARIPRVTTECCTTRSSTAQLTPLILGSP
jgi:hypothetical protein